MYKNLLRIHEKSKVQNIGAIEQIKRLETQKQCIRKS